MRLIDADKLREKIDRWFKYSQDGYMDYVDIATIVNREPTIEPVKWHKVNDELPQFLKESITVGYTVSDNVIITDGKYYQITFYDFELGVWVGLSRYFDRVIAWAELPKYEEVKNDKDN